MTFTGLEFKGLRAAIEKRRGEFRPVLVDAVGAVIVAGKWEKKRSTDGMLCRADALLNRYKAGKKP